MREVCGARTVVSGTAIRQARFDVRRTEFARVLAQVGDVGDDELLVITVQRLSACDMPDCLAHGDSLYRQAVLGLRQEEGAEPGQPDAVLHVPEDREPQGEGQAP